MPPFPRKSLPFCIHTDIRLLAKILLCEECVFLCTRVKRVWAGLRAGAWLAAAWESPGLCGAFGPEAQGRAGLGEACAWAEGDKPPPRLAV